VLKKVPVVDLKIPLAADFVTTIARLDHFNGQWSMSPGLPPDRLFRLEEAARIQSVAASCRLAGMRVTDSDVAALLRGEAPGLRDSPEVRGYAAGLAVELSGGERLLGGDALRALQATILGAVDPVPWRTVPLDREAFDADGKATGTVFSTLPPRLVEGKTDELLTWLELELRSGEQHPILVIGVFALGILSISPFDRGNGRLSRLLAGHLLRRAGYHYTRYASLEREVEALRCDYQQGLLKSQTRLWSGEADLHPWLAFFLLTLDRQRERVEAKVALERESHDYPPLQRAILETVREHGDADAALLLRATGANRNTLKDNLRRLVQTGVLQRLGQRRGTRYRMATGEPARPGADGGVER